MAENSNNGVWFVAGLGLGVFIGGLFMCAIIKSQQSLAQAQALITPAMQSMDFKTPPINIYPILREEAVHHLRPPLMPLPLKLPILREDAVHHKVPELQGVIEAPVIQSPHQPAAAPTTIYNNNEKWAVERGEDGYIKSLYVVRDAKVNAQE